MDIKYASAKLYCKRLDVPFVDTMVDRVMSFIELMTDNGLDDFTDAQQKELLLGYIQQVDIDLYYKRYYSPKLMEKLRTCLVHNIPICQMLGRRTFSEIDLVPITGIILRNLSRKS